MSPNEAELQARCGVHQQLEDLQAKVARIGLDIDRAMRGDVNEQSPIAGRLRMIAASVQDRVPKFDAMAPAQEELAAQLCNEIAGPMGQPGRPPDPVRLLEMAEALYQAEMQGGVAPAA